MDFSLKLLPPKSPKNVYNSALSTQILLFLVLLLLQTFPTSTSYFLNNFNFQSLLISLLKMKKNHQKWRILFRLDFLSILEQNPPLLVLFFSKSSTFGYENLKNLHL